MSSRSIEIDQTFKSPTQPIFQALTTPLGHASQPQISTDTRVKFFTNNKGTIEGIKPENRPYTASLLPSISDDIINSNYQIVTRDASNTQRM